MVRNSRLSTFFYQCSFLYANQPSRPPIYLLLLGYSDRASEIVPAADHARLPSCASVGLEIDLIRIQIYAFDLRFVRGAHPHDNMLERTD